MKYKEYIENHTLRIDASRRGGGIEIDLQDMFLDYDNPRMSAYQNYLGGGICGRVQASANFEPMAKDKKKYLKIADALKRYFHAITNEAVNEYDEWASVAYEKNQNLPTSAY